MSNNHVPHAGLLLYCIDKHLMGLHHSTFTHPPAHRFAGVFWAGLLFSTPIKDHIARPLVLLKQARFYRIQRLLLGLGHAHVIPGTRLRRAQPGRSVAAG
jgi:hypothetical protein